MIAALITGLFLAQAAPVLTLDDALKTARSQSLDIKVAQARLDQAHQISHKTWAAYLPKLTVGGGYTYNNVEAVLKLPVSYYIDDACPPEVRASSPGLCPSLDKSPPDSRLHGTSYVTGSPAAFSPAIPIQKHNQIGGQVELDQAILAPALWPAIQASYLAEEAAELNVENAKREILFAVAQLYYGAVGLKEAQKLQQQLLETNLAHEKDAKVRVDAGAAPKVVLLRAEIDRARSEQDVLRAKNAYLSMKSSLASILDRDENFDVVQPQDPPAPATGEELEKLSQKRPDVLAAEKALAAAEKGKTSSQLMYLPNIGFQGVYRGANITGFTGTNTSWFVSLGLNWTLLDGGLREATIRENAARTAEAEASLKAARLRADDELRRARLDYESAVANKVKAEEQLKLAQENQQLVEVGFKAGTSTQLEVADANSALLGAQLAQLSENLNAQLAVLKLAKAAGVFNPQ